MNDAPSSAPGAVVLARGEIELASILGGSVVQLVVGAPDDADATVVPLVPATVVVTSERVVAVESDSEWSWMLDEIESVHHGVGQPWTILVVPEVADHGVAVPEWALDRFRNALARAMTDAGSTPAPPSVLPVAPAAPDAPAPPTTAEVTAVEPLHEANVPEVPPHPAPEAPDAPLVATATATATATADPDAAVADPDVVATDADAGEPAAARPAGKGRRRFGRGRARAAQAVATAPLTGLEAREISAWFGTHHVLDRVSLDMSAGKVTALIGPSGCGKSTFLRILNRMHEMIPSASLSGEVLLDGADIYDVQRKLTDARRQIGMVFQKPNPFPAMSIYDNVVASFQLTGLKVGTAEKDETVESCLRKAGLWNEVRDRLRSPGGGLSGGQQQRLCIARALAIKPRVLLMDEPCSALDPTSTRRIEQTIVELASEVTIVIVTHNMQQAARVSDQCAFFLAEQGTPGVIVEHGPTEAMFHSPQDPRTFDYVNGRFG